MDGKHTLTPNANPPEILNFLNTRRSLLELVGLILVLVGLGLTTCELRLTTAELAVARKLREAQLIAMASEMVFNHRSEDLSERDKERAAVTHGRVASAARSVLERAVAEKVSLAGFNASFTNLADAMLPGVDFRGGKLYRASLLAANLKGANFGRYPAPTAYRQERSELRADLSRADLSGADLSNANLSMADLSRANLSNSIIRAADFNGTILTGTVFSGADLSDAKNLHQSQLADACGNGKTKLPHSLDIEMCQKSEDPLPPPASVDSSTDQTTEPTIIRGASDEIVEVDGGINNLESRELRLEQNTTYEILGHCDDDCLDLDLSLYDPRGNQVAGDYDLDNMPLIIYAPPESGVYRLQIMMMTCSLEPCLWGVGIHPGISSPSESQ